MVRQIDRDVVNLPYTLVCSLTYMRLRHSVIKPAFELRAVMSLNSKGNRQPFHKKKEPCFDTTLSACLCQSRCSYA